MGYWLIIIISFNLFTALISLVAMIKVLQIAEDIRNERHVVYGHGGKPKPYGVIVLVCAIVSIAAATAVLWMYSSGMLEAADMMQNALNGYQPLASR